jgi:stearoyl-CoA desaturase (delta-9 desaturase)
LGVRPEAQAGAGLGWLRRNRVDGDGMMDSSFFYALLDWLAHGWLAFSAGQVLLYVLLTTHLTIVSVTIFLHRAQAHRALELHPLLAHVFRCWLWLGTGMVTQQWVAIHRKHHAKCETEQDPHSPQTRGIHAVFWRGAELYKQEALNAQTLQRYGHGTPDDWLERNLYSRHSLLGISLMLLLDVAFFGVIGLTVWAVQMVWIPFWAAGVVNGLGHYVGYRNFEAADASTNLMPWGIVIGGEELHNNHHTYPTSAKFAVKPYEFDIAWVYIRLLQKLGLAQVRKTPPRLRLGQTQAVADERTLEAVIAHRYEVMAQYARHMQRTCKTEMALLRAKGVDIALLKIARRWLHRDDDKVPPALRPRLLQARAQHPVLEQMHAMREELRTLWLSTSRSREQLAADLQAWCQRAEASGIAALREFSLRLRSVQA